jgi:hypothetical protein
MPNVTLLEAPWANREAETDVCWPYPEIVDGYALTLEGPGLGIEFDEKLAASKPFVPSLPGPRLRGQVEWAGWIGTGFLNCSYKSAPLNLVRSIDFGLVWQYNILESRTCCLHS